MVQKTVCRSEHSWTIWTLNWCLVWHMMVYDMLPETGPCHSNCMVGTDTSHICCTDTLQKNQLHVNRNLLAAELASKYCVLTSEIKQEYNSAAYYTALILTTHETNVLSFIISRQSWQSFINCVINISTFLNCHTDNLFMAKHYFHYTTLMMDSVCYLCTFYIHDISGIYCNSVLR